MSFITIIQAMYDQAFSSEQINGYVAGNFRLRISFRQGCPMNMLLFAWMLFPLLYLLERNLTGIRTGHCAKKTAVVTYTNDVMIFFTTLENIQLNGKPHTWTYEREKGSCLNILKSKVMAAGSWDTSINIMDVPYYPETTIVGFRFRRTVGHSGNVTWSRVTEGQSPNERTVGRSGNVTWSRVTEGQSPNKRTVGHSGNVTWSRVTEGQSPNERTVGHSGNVTWSRVTEGQSPNE